MKNYKLDTRIFCLLMAVITSCGKTNEVTDANQVPPPQATNPPSQKKWIVSTIAGRGDGSFVNGPSLSAGFHSPSDIALFNGVLYVTDVLNFCVRKVAGGRVTTVAGGTGFDIVDGPGVMAEFRFPYSITVDGNGTLYSTDDGDPRVRRINAENEVSTYAGTAVPGYMNGRKDTARFNSGGYIVSDIGGNLYLSDGTNNRIRKVSTSGQVTTIAPDYVFSFPGGIAIDRNNNLFVANRGAYTILEITAAGAVSILAGNGIRGYKDGGTGEAEFTGDMRDLVIDSQGNLYLSDDNRIRKITRQGVVSTVAGSNAGFNDGDSATARFNYPNGMAVDDQDNIYVADLNNNRIRKISLQ